MEEEYIEYLLNKVDSRLLYYASRNNTINVDDLRSVARIDCCKRIKNLMRDIQRTAIRYIKKNSDLSNIEDYGFLCPKYNKNKFSVSDIEEIIEQLPSNERKIFDMWVYDKLTSKQISDKLGISVRKIAYIKNDIRSKIKTQLEEV
jgi:RNA polymerase sigma factor (sigma-70 family)